MVYSGDEVYGDDVTSGILDPIPTERIDPTETLRHRCTRTDPHTIGECIDYREGADQDVADVEAIRRATAILGMVSNAFGLAEVVAPELAKLRAICARIDAGEL